jgi:pantothenate kinase-related protein Tda10
MANPLPDEMVPHRGTNPRHTNNSHNSDIVIVGIAGPSCSGKTSLSSQLFEFFQCDGSHGGGVLCQDDFATVPLQLYPLDDPDSAGNAAPGTTDPCTSWSTAKSRNSWLNWEAAETMDIPSFVKTIEEAAMAAAKMGDKYFFVEGFVLLEGGVC